MDLSLNSVSIRALRCRMGWCQSELAQHLGVSGAVIRAWENGEQTPTRDQAQTLDFLFRRTETSMLEIQQKPQLESLLESSALACVTQRDLVRDRGGSSVL